MSEISVEALIPHRKPMLLVDSISQLSETEIVATKHIAADSFFLQGHYPDFPIVPGVITCECMFQAGAALLSHKLSMSNSVGDRVPVIARIENAKFKTPIKPGDDVALIVRIKDEMNGVYFLKGEARVNDKVVASVEFACAMAPRPKS